MASLVNNGQSAKPPQTLTQMYLDAKHIFFDIEQRGVGSRSALECAHLFEECVQRIRHNSIFSNNEEVDDIKTGELQYLLAHAYLGKLYGEKVKIDITIEGPAGRYKQIQRSVLHYTTFLSQLLDYNMLEENDKKFFIEYEADSRKESLEAKRARKIDAHEAKKALNAKMAEYIKKESESLQKVSKTNTALQEDKPTLLDEDDEREKTLTMIQLYVKEALNGIDISKREVEMLEQMRANMGDGFYGTKRTKEDPRIARLKKEQEDKLRERRKLQEYKNRPGK
eukprot:g7309.t1